MAKYYDIISSGNKNLLDSSVNWDVEFMDTTSGNIVTGDGKSIYPAIDVVFNLPNLITGQSMDVQGRNLYVIMGVEDIKSLSIKFFDNDINTIQKMHYKWIVTDTMNTAFKGRSPDMKSYSKTIKVVKKDRSGGVIGTFLFRVIPDDSLSVSMNLTSTDDLLINNYTYKVLASKVEY